MPPATKIQNKPQLEKGTWRTYYTETTNCLGAKSNATATDKNRFISIAAENEEIGNEHLDYVINEQWKCFHLHIKTDLISDKEWV